MSTPIVIVGAGGFGREVLDVLEAINKVALTPVFDLLGVLDANPSPENVARLDARGITLLGSESDWLKSGGVARYAIGIGRPSDRQRIDEAFRAAGHEAASLVHPMSGLGSAVVIGEGTIVCGGVQVGTNVTLGRHVHLNPNSTIGHDSVLHDYVSINPSATISGDVTVGTRTLVGAGAVIIQGLTLGRDAVVGASACVVRDIDERRTVKGVPAR
jgi:sugar O-acyltransferase (sialic acid O-acetyltransferase NeuD family)